MCQALSLELPLTTQETAELGALGKGASHPEVGDQHGRLHPAQCCPQAPPERPLSGGPASAGPRPPVGRASGSILMDTNLRTTDVKER